MTPKYIRDMIVLLGKMELSVYTNAMASIHTTLRRMKESGEVEEVQNSNGERAYRLPNQEDIAQQKAPTPPAPMRHPQKLGHHRLTGKKD